MGARYPHRIAGAAVLARHTGPHAREPLVGGCNWDSGGGHVGGGGRAGAGGVQLGTPHAEAATTTTTTAGAAATSTTTTTRAPGLDAAARCRPRGRCSRVADRPALLGRPRRPRRRAPTAPCSPRRRTRPARRPRWPGWSTATARPPSPSTSRPASPRWRPTAPTSTWRPTPTVFAYNRASGNQDGQWTMPAVTDGEQLERRPRRAGRRRRLRLRVGHPGQHGQRLPASTRRRRRRRSSSCAGWATPSGPTAPSTTSAPITSSSARRPDGSDRHRARRWRTTPNGLGGGVQYVDVVAGGRGVGQRARRPGPRCDASPPTTPPRCADRDLQRLGDEHRRGLRRRATRARAGRRQRRPARRPSQTPTSCVFRIDPHGAVGDAVGVGSAVTLLGPGPAVIVSDTTTGQFDLVRLS